LVKSIFETSPCAWTMSSLADEVGLCRTCSRCLISSWRSSSTVSNNSCPPCSTSTCPSSKPSDRTSRRSGLSLAGSSERAVSSARRAFWSSGFHSSLDLLVAISRNKENKRSRGCSEEKLQDGVDWEAGLQYERLLFLQFLFWHFEAVSHAAQRLQVLGMAGVRFNLFAEPPNVHIDGTRCDEGSLLPHRIQQLIAREYAAAMGCQVFEQAEFPYGGENIAPLHVDGHGRAVDFEITQAQDFARRWGLPHATQHTSDAGHQLTGAERLGDVVVSAQFQALHPVPLCRLCSEEDDRGRRKNRGLSDLSAQVKSVGARKHHIQKT